MLQDRIPSGPRRAGSLMRDYDVRFSTDALREERRVPLVNKVLAQGSFGTQIELLNDLPLQGLLVERSFPGFDLMWAHSSPLRNRRAAPVLARGSDSILFTAGTGPRILTKYGKEYAQIPGEGLAVGNDGPGSAIFLTHSAHVTIIVPQMALRTALHDKSAHFVQRVPPDNSAMLLLVSYLRALEDAVIKPELEQTVTAHVHDLLALTLGATCDGAELARTRGVRAARLQAIKRDVIRRLDGNLSIAAVAARHRLTPRHVQRLFESEGTTFTAFVREQRLLRARAMLASSRFDHMRIGAIAFEVGFGDLSYFIRVFVRRFGMSPGDVRAGSAAE